jgi:hypothetical protein
MSRFYSRCGFTIPEAVAGLAVAGLVLVFAVVGTSESRRSAGLGECLANLKRVGEGTGSYAADTQDRIWAFSWEANVVQETPWDDLALGDTIVQAHANQAVDIIRRRGVHGGTENTCTIPKVNGWLPINYAHLVLADYLGLALPSQVFACPQDRVLRSWQDDPCNKFDVGFWQPLQPPDGGGVPLAADRRWVYASSYRITTAAYDYLASDPTPAAWSRRIVQGFTHDLMMVSPANADLRGRPLSDVAHPSHKVHVFETHGRHGGARVPYYALAEASVPALGFDGSALARRTKEANRGWYPTLPAMDFATPVSYTPADFEPPTVGGGEIDYGTGHFRWTREGLNGRDFGGPEINLSK